MYSYKSMQTSVPLHEQAAMPSSWKLPFRICVGMSKGGTGKSWWAVNLAARLGRLGFWVLLIDTNSQKDSFRDYVRVVKRRGHPGFHSVYSDDPERDLSALTTGRHYDFIITDTAQFANIGNALWSWRNSDAMVGPIQERRQDLNTFSRGVAGYMEVAPGRPIFVIPCQTIVLHNSGFAKNFVKYLETVRKVSGAYLPPFPHSLFLDDNFRVRDMDVRNIYTAGASAGPKEEFILKFEKHIEWILKVLVKFNGELPQAHSHQLPLPDPNTLPDPDSF